MTEINDLFDEGDREFGDRSSTGLPPEARWMLAGFGRLEREIKDLRDTTDARLRSLENKAWFLVGGITFAITLIGLVGWVLEPLVQALANRTVSGM